MAVVTLTSVQSGCVPSHSSTWRLIRPGALKLNFCCLINSKGGITPSLATLIENAFCRYSNGKYSTGDDQAYKVAMLLRTSNFIDVFFHSSLWEAVRDCCAPPIAEMHGPLTAISGIMLTNHS